MLGQELRELRKAAKMSQNELARASGLTQNYISELESGAASNPSWQTLTRLAEGLHLPQAALTSALLQSKILVEPVESSPSAHRYVGYRERIASPDGRAVWQRVEVMVDDFPLPILRLEPLCATAGWGYHGSGPLALAYAMLAYEFGESIARYHAGGFDRDVVARLPREVGIEVGSYGEWELTSEQLEAWLVRQDRPDFVAPHPPPFPWVDTGTAKGTRAVIYEQFMLDTRFVFTFGLTESGNSFPPKIISVTEQQLIPDLESRLVWRDLREPEPIEYELIPQDLSIADAIRIYSSKGSLKS